MHGWSFCTFLPDPLLIVQVLLLLLAANGSPVLGKRLFGDRFTAPLDGGLTFVDGRRLLGGSKTWRGLALSLLATSTMACLLGLPWQLGLQFAAASMVGDAASSFTKRRLDVPPSGQALGLDQIPEALLPMWICKERLGLDGWTIVLLISLFFVGALLLSRIMYRFGIRDRPY